MHRSWAWLRIGVTDPLNLHPWKHCMDSFVENTANKAVFHIPRQAREKTLGPTDTQEADADLFAG